MNIPCGFEKPTLDFAKTRIAKFNKDNEQVESALTQLMAAFRENESLPHVLLKVAAINSLYSTQIYGVYKVAEWIVECNIDQGIRSGDAEIVGRIATVTFGSKEAAGDEKSRCNYSFATKYCSWHNLRDYPIYDTRVDVCLRAYQKIEPFTEKKFTQNDLWDYPRFRDIVGAFRNKYLPNLPHKEVDKFLYQLGNDCFYADGTTSSATPPQQSVH